MTFTAENLQSIDRQLSNRPIDLDPSGYFIIYVDRPAGIICAKHYTNVIDDRGLAVDPETGKVLGYQHLNEITTLLSDTLIRRTKAEVLKQLPERMDKNLFVPMTLEQKEIHDELQTLVSKLVNKWRRFGFLNEHDRQKLILSLYFCKCGEV